MECLFQSRAIRVKVTEVKIEIAAELESKLGTNTLKGSQG